MAERNAIVAVYSAGVIQGVALVTFPAASAIFSSPAYFHLSSTEYGGMFVPQAIMAIASSLMGGGLTRNFGIKRIYLLGLVANLLAMTFLVLSQFVMHNHAFAYGILLIATTCMGIGFGLTVPAINTLAAALFPRNVDRAVLVLNALLGVGTALAPAFVAIFLGLGIWWGLPVLVGAMADCCFRSACVCPLGKQSEAVPRKPKRAARNSPGGSGSLRRLHFCTASARP